MQIYQHKSELNGQPIRDWHPEKGGYSPEYLVYRVRVSPEDIASGHQWADQFAAFLESAETDQVTGLVVGAWSDAFDDTDEVDTIVQALVDACNRLPNLNAIFFGDIIAEECEMAWIHLSNLAPLFSAYPGLTYFGARGGYGLRLEMLHHEQLQTLVIEDNELGPEVVEDVLAAHLPVLKHLELWLGDDGGVQVDDLEPLFMGDLFPCLKYLGLRNSDFADDVAMTIANAPIIERLDELDLSLGQLSDGGAAALLESPAVMRLAKLNLHHHYCSEDMVKQFEALGIAVDFRYPKVDYMRLPTDSHKRELNGQPIQEWNPETSGDSSTYSIYRLRVPYPDNGERWVDRFAAFLEAVDTEQVAGLVVGAWSNQWHDFAEGSEQVDAIVEALVGARDRLPNLHAIFFGDVTMAECDMSMTTMSDMSPLFSAYPQLTYFGVRGMIGLHLGVLRHEQLRTLVIESKDMDRRVLQEVMTAHLPKLEHLELWLGAGNFCKADDLKPLFAGDMFPQLKYLGLRNSSHTDEIAVALANTPIIESLDVLDLSLGTLGHQGAAALLESPAIAQLKKLNLYHHYCSNEMIEQLQTLDMEINLDGAKEDPGGYNERYMAVWE